MVRAMGWKAAYTVRMSGLKGKTKTDVLEALAAMLNEKTGDCFPSTETIARVARVSPNFVRPTLKELEAEGLIQTIQKPGCVRYFRLFLDKLPEPLLKTEGVKEAEPLTEPLPLPKSKGVAELLGDSSRNREYPPNGTVRGPLTKPLPEQGKEQGREQGKEQVVGAFENAPPPTDSDLEAMASEENLFTASGQKVEASEVPPEEEPPKKLKKPREPLVPFPETLPDDWRALAQERRPEIDAEFLFDKMRTIFGPCARKTMPVWKRTFLNWLANERAKTYANNRSYYRGDPQPSPEILATIDYSAGTWGY